MSDHTMQCAYCGRVKRWPGEFTVFHYAKCRDCQQWSAGMWSGIKSEIRRTAVTLGAVFIIAGLGFTALVFIGG